LEVTLRRRALPQFKAIIATMPIIGPSIGQNLPEICGFPSGAAFHFPTGRNIPSLDFDHFCPFFGHISLVMTENIHFLAKNSPNAKTSEPQVLLAFF
jgi:hypothetical protein